MVIRLILLTLVDDDYLRFLSLFPQRPNSIVDLPFFFGLGHEFSFNFFFIHEDERRRITSLLSVVNSDVLARHASLCR